MNRSETCSPQVLHSGMVLSIRKGSNPGSGSVVVYAIQNSRNVDQSVRARTIVRHDTGWDSGRTVNRRVSICHRSVELPDEIHRVVRGAVGNVGHVLGESFALFPGD